MTTIVYRRIVRPCMLLAETATKRGKSALLFSLQTFAQRERERQQRKPKLAGTCQEDILVRGISGLVGFLGISSSVCVWGLLGYLWPAV